jgi:hypothetical protein
MPEPQDLCVSPAKGPISAPQEEAERREGERANMPFPTAAQ